MATALRSTSAIVRRDSAIWSRASLGLVLITAVLVHSYNMFNFPLYQGDEGIYMARAYSVIKLGWLTPYTYWYDHAPAGWLFLALWSALTGGFKTFGTAIDGGRVFILLLHVASVILLYRLVLRLTRDAFAGMLTALLYTLSPLTIVYGRMVLLDNIMIFWLLLATMLLLLYKGKLWLILYSGACFGVAVLTKENAALLMPAFLYGLWTLANKSHARFARFGWLYMAISIISFYPLYATLRKELIDFSLALPFATNEGSVSLVGAVFWQLGRSGGAPWSPSSDFYLLLTQDWLVKDPWIIGLGVVASLWNVFRPDHSRRLVALLSFLAIFGIGHGNQVFDFYIISVLPFLALNVGLAIADLTNMTRSPALLPVAIIAIVGISWFNLNHQRHIFTLELTTIQRQALDWIRAHAPSSAQIVTNDDLWVDLREGGAHHQSFPGAHSHWQVANDPAVYHDLFHNDYRIIDYIIVSPGLAEIFAANPDKLTYQAYRHSTPVASFSEGTATVEIRKVNHAGIAVKEMLAQAYNGFVRQYIHNGRVQSTGGYTDARDQAAAMLMAVWMDDQETFDQLWSWMLIHLRNDRGLFYHTTKPGAKLHSATDVDTDIALALLLAERRWHNASYGRHAKEIIKAIWKHEVVEVKGKPYLAAGDWAISKEQVIFAPATFAPYAYHFFAEADPENAWWYLLDTNYKLLARVTRSTLGEQESAGLPPAYVGINRRTGTFRPNPVGAPAPGNRFDENAAQVYWRVGLDAQWHDDGRADSFLTASSFLADEWNAQGKLVSSYSHAGWPQTQEERLTLYSAVLPKFLIEDPELAHQVYTLKLVTTYNQTQGEGQWGEAVDVGQARWAWLATALYTDSLQYQWDKTVTVPRYSFPKYETR